MYALHTASTGVFILKEKRIKQIVTHRKFSDKIHKNTKYTNSKYIWIISIDISLTVFLPLPKMFFVYFLNLKKVAFKLKAADTITSKSSKYCPMKAFLCPFFQKCFKNFYSSFPVH